MTTQSRSAEPDAHAADTSGDTIRAEYRERLRQRLQDPTFRATEGFPIGDDQTILDLSDPPYYTSCPNPFLVEGVDAWRGDQTGVRSALSEFDDSGHGGDAQYHREPFTADISEGKGDPIYNAHTYHTKVPHRAIMRYLIHYTKPGDVVLDAFCGSGMTGVAAQFCSDRNVVESLGYRVDDGKIFDGNKLISHLGARRAVLIDLSPAASFIAYNYNFPVDVTKFESALNRIVNEVEDEAGWMYETWHPRVDSPNQTLGRINYTVWSDVFVCPVCGKELIFWDVAVDKESGQVRDSFACPHCSSIQTKRTLERAKEMVHNEALGGPIERAKTVPVLVNYSIGRKRFEKAPDASDLAVIATVEEGPFPYWYPKTRIDNDIDMWYERDYRSLGIFSVDSFFTKRNLYLLSALWSRSASISDHRVAQAVRFCLTGMQVNLSRMNRWRANVSFPYNPLSGTLYVSALQSEANVFTGIRNKANRLANVWRTGGRYEPDKIRISTQSASDISAQIQDGTVDYIFTDPPFGSNIIYSDLSIIWESWLGIATQTASEAVVHRRKKTGAVNLDGYRLMMTDAFAEMYRALKPGRWLTVEFHNTQNSVWNAIQQGIVLAGFVIADVRTLDKQLGTFKQVTTSSAVKQDLIISAYKPASEFEQLFALEAGTESGAWDFLRQHLFQLPRVVEKSGVLESIAERLPFLLFDRMVAFHIQRGTTVPLSAAQFYAGLRQQFVERDGMIFLPDQVPEYDAARMRAERVGQLALFVNDEKSSIQWLRQLLDPATGGSPLTYQEILPQFLRQLHQARHEQLPELGEILDQNFLQDPQGRWYVPDPNRAEDLERVRRNALLREFATYLAGRGRLRSFRTEAVRAGFADAYRRAAYDDIVKLAERLPEAVLQEDPDLLMYYDNASLRAG